MDEQESRRRSFGTPETRLFELFDDLESQAEAWHSAERRTEVADRARASYREVPLQSRLLAARGEILTLRVRGIGLVAGELTRAGTGWVELEGAGHCWLIPQTALLTVTGVGERAVPAVAWGVVDRLTVASPLRALADGGESCRVHLVDQTWWDGRIGRVGADFVEVLARGEVSLVALEGLAGIRHQG